MKDISGTILFVPLCAQYTPIHVLGLAAAIRPELRIYIFPLSFREWHLWEVEIRIGYLYSTVQTRFCVCIAKPGSRHMNSNCMT